MIVNLFKYYLRPDSPLAIVIVFGIGVAWLWLRPSSRSSRRYLLGAVLAFWFASTPLGAGATAWSLSHGLASIASRNDAQGARAVVVLGGGARTFTVGGAVVGALTPTSIMRALEGARVAHLIDATLVVASGGEPRPDVQLKPESEMLRETLIAAGVRPMVILEEPSSTTTKEQATLLAPVLRARGAERFVLVTSATHMRRSLAVFRAEGLDPIPSVAPIRSTNLKPPPLFLPNDESLALFDQAIYDYAAGAYYWLKGYGK